METWIWTLGSVVIVSLISLIGALTFLIKDNFLQKILTFMVSFAVGAIFGDAFLHILPEIYASEIGETAAAHAHGAGNIMTPTLIIVGILFFFSLEKFLRWRHCHHLPDNCDHKHPVAVMNLIGDGAHNFLDGILIAGSYMVSIQIGIATTIAVILHEIPQEIGDFATLLHAGYKAKKALFFNLLVALTSVLGAFIVLALNPSLEITKGILLPLTAGGFIYIAGSDLIPILHEKNKPITALFQVISIALGTGIMILLMIIE
ncbi:ZIP family metal transporter [Patescibacteria group bacterium]|nr:ZIP family metal transporter [Patescibacteria group bacterium]